MPIPVDRIQAVEDEIERENEIKFKKDSDDDDSDNEHRHTTAMTPPNQDFSFLQKTSQPKRSVHYDIEHLDDYEHRPLRTIQENDSPKDNVLRRRYIAHWGLPG